MKTRFTVAAIAIALIGAPAFAGHNNPWATADDTILSQYHEEYLEKSVDTPGEDEMLGTMVQKANGKL